MWVDADALILRHDIPLTEFLDDDADFIGGDDSPNELLNMGVFFVRNCPGVAELFRRAYAKTEYTHHPWWETLAVMETIREGVPGLRVKVVPRRLFNCYPHEFCEGDFAIHFAGRSHAERTRELRRYAAPLLSIRSLKARTGGALRANQGPTVPHDNIPVLAPLLSELIVWESSRLRTLRLGSRHDGGYIVPDLRLEAVDFLYAVGVGNNLDFEHEFRAFGRASIKLFDPTIAPPSNLPDEAEFFPVGLGVHAQSVTTLFQYGQRPDLRRHRLWLKMDIEGWEWETLALTEPECLELFEVLIIEFHGLTDRSENSLKRKTACLKKINHRFRLVHAHGNNYASQLPVADMLLPDCLEATYLRADLVPGKWRHNRNPLPGPLDAPCNPNQADLDLNSWPFRDLGRLRNRPNRRRDGSC